MDDYRQIFAERLNEAGKKSALQKLSNMYRNPTPGRDFVCILR